MDSIIRDVFIDYTRNYMTPEDVITGKLSFLSLFLSREAKRSVSYPV